ncbi:hypothetical protein DOY81_012575 [Sarcophaga bullata]|nr:hypothetical protein DOY81_012575 [Sarcophaga bullata]
MADVKEETQISTEKGEEKVIFKKKARKNLRQRRNSDEEPSEEPLSLEEIKERQKLRERPHGVSVVALALGKKLAPEEEIT